MHKSFAFRDVTYLVIQQPWAELVMQKKEFEMQTDLKQTNKESPCSSELHYTADTVYQFTTGEEKVTFNFK